MICNGINFSDEWLAKFDSAEEFVDHPKQQAHVQERRVTNAALHSFFELYLSQKNQTDGNIDQSIPAAIPEAESQGSDRGDGERQEGSDSGSAGDPAKQGGKKRRNTAS